MISSSHMGKVSDKWEGVGMGKESCHSAVSQALIMLVQLVVGGGGAQTEADSRLLTSTTEAWGGSSISHRVCSSKNHRRCSHFPSPAPTPFLGTKPHSHDQIQLQTHTHTYTHALSPQSHRVFSQSYTPRHQARNLNIVPRFTGL